MLGFDINRWHYIQYLCSTHETYIPLYVISMCVYLCIVLVVVCGLRLCFLFKIYLLWSRRGELRCVLWHMILVKLNSHSYKKVLCRKYAMNDVIQKQKIKIICLFVFCNWIFKICYLWIIQTEFLFWVSSDFRQNFYFEYLRISFFVWKYFLIYTIFCWTLNIFATCILPCIISHDGISF